jgi:hypothetical protein
MRLFVASLLAETSLPAPFLPSPTKQPLSTDVFLVAESGQATPLALLATNAPPVLYETELVVFVHRVRDTETKLVESKSGPGGAGGGRAMMQPQQKSPSLAAATALAWSVLDVNLELQSASMLTHADPCLRPSSQVDCSQGCESAELLDVLGRRLVTRQGYRAYFTPDDTALYAVREIAGSLFIDQLDIVRGLARQSTLSCLSLTTTLLLVPDLVAECPHLAPPAHPCHHRPDVSVHPIRHAPVRARPRPRVCDAPLTRRRLHRVCTGRRSR